MAPQPDDKYAFPTTPPFPYPTDIDWMPSPIVKTFTKTKTDDRADFTLVVTRPDGAVETSYGYRHHSTTDPYEEHQAAPTTVAAATTYSMTGFPPPPPPGPHHPDASVFAAAGAVTALIVVGLALLCCFLLYRKRRNQRNSTSGVQMEERRGILAGFVGQPKTVAARTVEPETDTRSYIQPPRSPPPAIIVPSASVPSTQNPDQPVILSRTMDQSYYTGIDTSDHLSLVETRSQTSSEAYAESQDEPPPPYRPASVPPISRDNSVRISNPLGVDRNRSLRESIRDMRSPFDDPEEEVSDLEEEATTPTQATLSAAPQQQQQGSTPSQPARRGTDTLSDVSDLSYQQEETRPRLNL